VQCEAAAAKPAACSLQKAASKQSVVAASKHWSDLPKIFQILSFIS
jgi:hypothetical protein